MNTDAWANWENQVVNGAFALRRLLGSSSHGAVFLTEHKAKGLPNAAIKLVRADSLQAQDRLARWQAAAALTHPHVVRLFEAGRCQLGGHEFIFVVMEHAEQTLAQILRRRALSADEVRELLLPTLDALSFLHRNQLVHGQLKPSSLLAVDDKLKLASDNIRPAGPAIDGLVRTSAYDPPELKDGMVAAAGDIWGLGVTLVEALTQRTPALSDRQSEAASLAASLPTPFAYTVRRCLSISPTDRPSVVELAAQYGPEPKPAASTAAPQPPADEVSQTAATPQSSPKRPFPLSAIAGAVLVALAAWGGFRLTDTLQAQLQPSVVPDLTPTAPSSAIAKSAAPESKHSSADARPPVQPSPPPATTSPSVLHEVTPDVPQKIRDKIRGRIYVTVRVLVDSSGNVIGALMEDPGPSKYFARLGDHASREWQFIPADNQNTRVWLLRFEFRRDGVSARPLAQ